MSMYLLITYLSPNRFEECALNKRPNLRMQTGSASAAHPESLRDFA
jgi:hypothetical protein